MPVVRNILLFIVAVTFFFACEPKQEEAETETPVPTVPEDVKKTDVPESKETPETKDAKEKEVSSSDKVNPDEVANKPKKDKPERAQDGNAPKKP